MTDLINPFDLVKASDLTDEQIAEYFVDFPDEASLLARIKPNSRMPMIIFGGKGSGKTHLMRYLSYPLQLRRNLGQPPRMKVAKDGYLGIYFKASGLNGRRFDGKGQSEVVWQEIFAYYLELWTGQLVFSTIQQLYADAPELLTNELIQDATRLLDIAPNAPITSLRELLIHLENLQREADVAINNCALTRRLEIKIQATAGQFVFGLPRLLTKHLPDLKDIIFLYLIDEFENLSESQQCYVNTLIRERQDPCTFKIGVRLYGFRTRKTLSAGEENREDAEYEALRLDTELRNRPEPAQIAFAEDLVRRRLVQSGYLTASAVNVAKTSDWFEIESPEEISAELAQRYGEKDPLYRAELQKKLAQGMGKGVTPGISSKTDIERVINSLTCQESPFVERISIFLFYRAWAKRNNNLIKTAEKISDSARKYIQSSGDTLHDRILRHWRSDIIAQFLSDTKQKQRYLGFETFVRMSAGLPRGLLTILKHIFTWSQFYGEQPFKEGRISIGAQCEGVAQASEWFFNEARAPGPTGTLVRDAMTRLGQLFRDIRFSDKPSECSLSAFSASLAEASESARTLLDCAANWSMLIRVTGGGHDKNASRVDDKFQVHPMLAPRWDLPISRRGTVGLSSSEVDAIFSPANPAAFTEVLKTRIAAMTAPFFGQESISADTESQPSLPGMDHE